jgi:6-phosphogluconolactonase/glucosamine-6-phosphate isomerase/deaminase
VNIEVLADADAVASKAAAIIAPEARDAVVARGRFIMAVSGGLTPWQMLRALAAEKVPDMKRGTCIFLDPLRHDCPVFFVGR